MPEILDRARAQVLSNGVGLDETGVLEVLRLPDDDLPELLQVAHDVRMRWCGPEVEVEGIVSLKTGGCPEDCHFCSQSGLFDSPVRSAWLDIPSLVEAARQTAKTGATEFCIVAAVRGPNPRLMGQVAAGIAAIRDELDINIACSLGMLTPEQVDELAAMGAHRRHGGLLRRHHRDGGDARTAGGVRRTARGAGARRGAAELPQSPARHPVRRPRAAGGGRRAARRRGVPAGPAADGPAVRRRA